MKDKSQKVSTKGSVAESQRRDLDGARVGRGYRTAATGASRLQCVRASGENNATRHFDGTRQNVFKNSDDRVRATAMTIGCNSRPLGVVDEDRTRAASMRRLILHQSLIRYTLRERQMLCKQNEQTHHS